MHCFELLYHHIVGKGKQALKKNSNCFYRLALEKMISLSLQSVFAGIEGMLVSAGRLVTRMQ